MVPWRLDFATLEEDLFHRLLTSCPRSRLSVDGCRAFAGQFRERVEARQARALALVDTSRACVFALLPVPARVLALGPEDPAAQDWLMAYWGTTELRQVTVLPAQPGRSYLPPGHRGLRIGFFSADWSPWQALRALCKTWPALLRLLDLLIAGLVVYDAPVAPVQPVYRPMVRTLLSVQVALTWLRSLLAAHPDGGELAQFLPAQTALTKEPTLHSRAALASTFLAGLELTKQEAAQMAQDEDFGDIQLQAAD